MMVYQNPTHPPEFCSSILTLSLPTHPHATVLASKVSFSSLFLFSDTHIIVKTPCSRLRLGPDHFCLSDLIIRTPDLSQSLSQVFSDWAQRQQPRRHRITCLAKILCLLLKRWMPPPLWDNNSGSLDFSACATSDKKQVWVACRLPLALAQKDR